MNKQDWDVKLLGDVATFVNGYAFKPEDWSASGLPIVRIQNLNSNRAIYNFSKKVVDSKYIIKYGDILISWSASLGVYEWLGGEALLNQHIFKVFFDKLEVNKYFFKYQILNKIEEMLMYTHGATMKHITKKNFDRIKFFNPSLAIQKRIVKELDLLNDIIAQKKKQLTELDKLAQATFYEMFGDPVKNEKGWESKKIKDFSYIKIGPFGSSLHVEDYVENGIPLVNPSHMNNGKVIHSLNKTISEKKSKELASYLLKKDDVVIGRRGEIGRCAIITEKEEGFICGTGSLFIRFFDYMEPLYFYFVFTSKPIVKNLLNEAKGATMLNLNSKIIGNVNIIVPPLSLQTQFAERIKEIEQQKSLIEQSIVDVQQLFDSAMDKYFH